MAQELSEKVSLWIVKAENDIKVIQNLLGSSEVITDAVCFHSQQAAEKYLKAYLVSNGIDPEKTHKIERLIETCLKIDPAFIELKDAVLLTEYAVEFRYPDDFYIPDEDEARSAFRLAVVVKDFVGKDGPVTS
jgi:HEPN domain-containing protein